MMKPLCIYHGNCADGFAAAWAVRKALGEENVDFYAGVHQNPPPDVIDRDVIIVDFSYKLPVLLALAEQARSVLVLDHHKSAAEDLADIPRPLETIWDHWHEAAYWDERDVDREGPYLRALFDMERSGAGIAWDYFHADERPSLIDHIEDRDLWRFRLVCTREIQAVVFSYPYDFKVWDWLIEKCPISELIREGAGIERKHHKDIAELVGVTQRRMVLAGYNVPVANLPYTLASDAGHLMAQGEMFAACYWDTPEGRVFSLRSTDDGIDVSEIAKSYGGGGHRSAAGFRMPIGWEGDK